MSDDPIRFRDDPQRAKMLRDDLRAAATATPAALDLAAGMAKLESSLQQAASAGTTGAGATAAGSAAPSATAGILWFGSVLGLAGIVVAAILVTTRDDVGSAPHSVSVQQPRRSVSPTAPPATSASTANESPAAQPSPRANAEAPVASPGPRRAERLGRAGAETAAAPDLDLITREIELVARARVLLAADPAAALAAAETARSESPDGPLAEEREALAILALNAIGRREEARRSATAYLERWPSGTQRARIQDVLDEGEDR